MLKRFPYDFRYEIVPFSMSNFFSGMLIKTKTNCFKEENEIRNYLRFYKFVFRHNIVHLIYVYD